MFWLFFGKALSGFGGACCEKMNSKTVAAKKGVAYVVALLLNGLIACLFFAISSKFQIWYTHKTLAFAALYAAIATASIVIALKLYQISSVSNVVLIRSAASMILTSVLGWTLFQEKVYLKDVLRNVCMICASVFVFLSVKEGEALEASNSATEKKRGSKLWLFWILLFASIAVTCSSTLVLKAYAQSTNVANTNSWFFFTNVILVLGNCIAFFVLKTKEKAKMKEIFSKFSFKEVLFMMGNSVCSNIGSLIQVALLAKIAVSLFSPIDSALSVLVGIAASFAFREKQGKFTWIALGIVLVAILM